MKNKKNKYFYFILIILVLTSCKGNDFEVVSEEVILLKNNEIASLPITDKEIERRYKQIDGDKSERNKSNIYNHIYTYNCQLLNLNPISFSARLNIYDILHKKENKALLKLSEDFMLNLYNIEDERVKNLKEEIKSEILNEKLKGIKSKISIKNNSNQIIEKSNLTVLIKYTFENEKVFNYIKPYVLVANKVWNKDETLDLNLNDVIDFSETDELRILNIHTPKNVRIEYYITAKNSLDYNNIGKTKETLNLRYPNDFYSGSSKAFGIFTSKPLKEQEILGFGEKILSEDITDLWNENLKSETINPTVKGTKNGDLDKTFVNQDALKKKNEEEYKKEKKKLISEGWKDEKIQNGQLSSCYNFKPTKGNIKNRLEVIVGGGTDVSIKIMNIKTEKCIRYVFINSGTTYSIENIPEGMYYLKIAYGKDWLSKVENGQCVGKFIKNPLYEKGEDILDFNIKRESNGRSIPSYQLSLDVVSSGISNSFNSQNISESDFNK